MAFTAMLSTPAMAVWQLSPDQSRVTATVVEITPSGPIPHEHQVRQMQGQIGPDGTLRLPITLRQTDIVDMLGSLPPWMTGLADMPLVTIVTHLPPEHLNDLAVGETRTESLMMGGQTEGMNEQELLKVNLTRESADRIRVRNAEHIALDGQELMQNQTARSILLLLGYERIGDEVPVELDAVLVDR
ncbi:hypothetical protein GCM10027040_05030 [Halomonas shantousis]